MLEVHYVWFPEGGRRRFADLEGDGRFSMFCFESEDAAFHYSAKTLPVRAKITVEYDEPCTVDKRFYRR